MPSSFEVSFEAENQQCSLNLQPTSTVCWSRASYSPVQHSTSPTWTQPHLSRSFHSSPALPCVLLTRRYKPLSHPSNQPRWTILLARSRFRLFSSQYPLYVLPGHLKSENGTLHYPFDRPALYEANLCSKVAISSTALSSMHVGVQRPHAISPIPRERVQFRR